MLAMWHNGNMDWNAVIARLRAHRSRLNELGIEGVSLFGSVARGDAAEGSDIDLAVKLGDCFSRGGFDYFARMEALRGELAIVLDSHVDVVEEPAAHAELQAQIERDRIVAFQ